MMARQPRRPVQLVMLAVFAAGGCGQGAGMEVASDGGIFVAFSSNFADFRSWPMHSFESAVAQGATHVAGARTVYINRLPPAGERVFPVGTMIVKVSVTDGQIFALVKRGGGYNQSGAKDWEWFELVEGVGGVSIKWHGVGPPAGEKYAGDPANGCNPCHAAARNNDYVMSPWLQLGSFAVDGGIVDRDQAQSDDAAAPWDGGVTTTGMDGAAEDEDAQGG